MKCETQQINYLKDRVAVKLFSSEGCRDYVKAIVKEVIGEAEGNLDNLTFVNPKVGANANVKEGIADVVFKCGDNFINVEVNYNKGKKIQAKNFAYLCHLYIKDQYIDKEYKGNIYYQININNYDAAGDGEFMYYSKLMEIRNYREIYGYFQIIDINVAQLREIDYNEIKKEPKRSLKRLLYMFVEKDERRLDELYGGDEVMEKVRNELTRLIEEFDSLLYYNPEELYQQDFLDEGKAIGLAEGEAVGLAKVARKMLQENVAIDVIKKCTGLTIKEINELRG